MIHIQVFKNQEYFQRIILKGHALFDDYGKDIVCAGVSSILTTTVNGILRIQNDALTYQQEDDLFQIIDIHDDDITQKLILNMILLFQELEEQYPKNIKVESEEETCQ